TGDSSVRVMPGDSLAFAVRFHPPIAVPFYATLYLASNADTQTVRLTGEGGFPQGVNEPILESAELQNYPNPFTGETMIRYTGGNGEEATLGIYDVMGREVLDLTPQVRESGGDIRVASSSLPAGMYYCVLASGEKRFVQRMIKME
ncbi:MAG TPA: T9SS type A sorting domain-containing protein, partial [Candidatus Kapabacteria bacterium]|nr:T9SS type A sorting domain-containing protein [Candidatus Kapabacteria bacterium]